MKFLQKLGKSVMLPVSVLPICGILLGLGYLLCPAAVNGGEITGVWQHIGFYLNKAGSAVINNMALLFVIGVSIGMSQDQHGVACLAGLVSWLEITFLLSADSVKGLIPGMDPDWLMAFDKIANPFIGIVAGLIGAFAYNRFRKVRLPEVLAFFSGKRFVAIATVLLSLAASGVLLGLWPLLFTGMRKLGEAIVSLGGIGAGIYAFLNRLLIPTGLHHALNNVFWFDTIGLGDLTLFWAGKTSADVSWSLGMYMSGFFPCMMFGVPGAALAMVRTAKNRKKAAGILGSSSVCSLMCGLTEPFEFSFMFTCFPLYVVYSLLYGVFTVICYYTGFRAGFSFSGGGIDLLLSASLPAAANTWQILPIGAAAFITFYGVFRFAIPRFGLKTPGREEEAENAPLSDAPSASSASSASSKRGDKYAVMARAFLKAVGGRENVVSADCCATRLRLTLRDSSLVRQDAARAAGAAGVICPDAATCQIIVGMTVQQVLDEFNIALTERETAETAPVSGLQEGAEVRADACSSSPSPDMGWTLKVPAGARVRAGEPLVSLSTGEKEKKEDRAARSEKSGKSEISEINGKNEKSKASKTSETSEISGKSKKGEIRNPDSDRTPETTQTAPFTFIIRDPVGIHARPAGEMVRLLQGLDCRVTVRCSEKTADGRSILDWMSLGAARGAELHLSAEGRDAEEALARLKKFMNDRL